MDVFNTDANNTAPITLESLVGDTQKYKSPDELAKAYVNAETFIETLKREKQEEAQKAADLASKLEVYERLAAAKMNDPTPVKADPPATAPNVNDAPKVENLEEKIRSTLEAERLKERKAANRNLVNAKLIEQFGDKAKDVLAAKANELGVGIDWLTAVAETSPNAFFKTVGIAENNTPGTPGIKNEVNPAALPNIGKARPDSYAFFAELRKSDPKRYYSAEVQRQIFEAAKSNPNFYKE